MCWETKYIEKYVMRKFSDTQMFLTTTDVLVSGEARIAASCIVIYGVVSQPTVITQYLVVNKSC